MQESVCTNVETCKKTPDAHDGKGYSGFIFVHCHMLTIDFAIVSLINLCKLSRSLEIAGEVIKVWESYAKMMWARQFNQ